jgi:hypothetical protein
VWTGYAELTVLTIPRCFRSSERYAHTRNDEYLREQSRRVHALAEKATPFTKERLPDLAEK